MILGYGRQAFPKGPSTSSGPGLPHPECPHGRGRRSSSKAGLTSPPRLPQAVQMQRDSMSDSRISSGQRSAFTAPEWPHQVAVTVHKIR